MYYDKLEREDKELVLKEVTMEKKSILVAYLLWFFLASCGIHRFYLGDKTGGAWMAALFIGGWLTTILLIGFIPLMIVGIWVLIDAFRIPTMIENAQEILKEEKARRIYENY